MRPNLTVLTLGVRDLGRSLAFYRDGLGWPTWPSGHDDVAFFDLNGVILALYGHDALAEDANVSPQGSGFSGITLAYNARSEQEVDQVLETVEKLGARIVKPAQKVFWGGYSSYFEDP